MKAIKTILAPMLGLFMFMVMICIGLGVINYERAQNEAINSDGTDLAIAEAMQKYGFCQDGDVFRDVEVYEYFISGLAY